MIYTIGDLHLSLNKKKPMDIFGEEWKNHHLKIKKDWISRVNNDDLILIAGDTSWAENIDEAKEDLDFLGNLPGKKVLVKGNHDFWWKSLSKLNYNFSNRNIFFLQNNSINYKEIVICGARGWACPNSHEYKDEDEKLYKREVDRLRLSLESVKNAKYIIVMLHYPPMNEAFESSGFTDLIHKYKVKNVIYGHIHGKNNFEYGPKGLINNVYYHLVSCDYLDFKLHELRLDI